ncbi:hypothetical protein [Brachybacterium squillarum]|uniref:hypothetical protein n=1 Tax=Brachybacterium squillarum TaxID=661979 RepID=UPI0022235A40|nr:hypothetical protein [Brachybacterium squillarum]MCW1803874.1 hypothetical protein [Brachybacterium squillarum]
MPYPDPAAGIRAVVFPDPVVAVRSWVRRAGLYQRVYPRLPAKHLEKRPFLIVSESGGTGPHDGIYTRVRLQFECWHEDSDESSQAARWLASLLLVWDEYEDVWNPRIIQDPTDLPDPETGAPVHRLAAEVSFVGEEQEILSTEGA